MKISLAYLYLDFSLPRRLLGLCHAGKELRDEAIRTFAFCVVSGFEKVVFAMDKGNTGGGGYRLACVTGGFLVRFLQTADCCF